jgi:hypothetical protein
VEILDFAPATISRPLCVVGKHAYAATWVHIRRTVYEGKDKDNNTITHDPPLREERQELVIVRDDGAVFGPAGRGALPKSELGVTLHLQDPPPDSRLWSGAGLKRYRDGERPAPADVFKRVVAVVDRFMDFDRSFANQRTMAEFVACYIMATYFLDAFQVMGYLWPNGETASGKTHLLRTVCELAYLGCVIMAGGTYATLRDLADYGATLAFDDAEDLSGKNADPDKRALLLAGNRRGTTVPVKEPDGKNKWRTRHVHAFCPRLFSAIRLPDGVLGSRSIVVPLVRSADKKRAKADPLDATAWPHDRRRVVDDLWAMGLTYLQTVREYDAKAAARARLSGRDLDTWRAVVAVALWLQEDHPDPEAGTGDLFKRMEALSVTYQGERAEFETTDATRLLIRALLALTEERGGHEVDLLPKQIAERINRLAREEDLTDGDEWTNARRVGHLLKTLRVGERGRTAGGKSRRIARRVVEALATSHGMPFPNGTPPLQNGTVCTNGTNGTDSPPDPLNSAVCAVCAGGAVLPEGTKTGTANGTEALPAPVIDARGYPVDWDDPEPEPDDTYGGGL